MTQFFQWMMCPANRLCDALHVKSEAERGVVRMLVNTLFCTTLGVLAVWCVAS